MSFYSTNATIPEEEEQEDRSPSSVHDRLLQVKKSIRKVTLETLKQTADADTVPSSSFEENNDPNSSFHLGMELFGQEVHIVEEVIQEKLSMIEQEMENVMKVTATPATVTTKSPVVVVVQGDKEDEMTLSDLEKEATDLQKNIQFLRYCSQARDLVDQAVTLSTPGLGVLGCGGSGGSQQVDHYVRAAQLVVQAQQCWCQARDIVVEKEQQSNGTSSSSLSSASLAAAYKILNALQQGIRKPKVDLLSRAQSLWKTSVSLQRQSLTVRSGQAIQQAYDVMETFASQDGNDNTLLEDTIRKFTTLVQQQVFAPALDNHRHHHRHAANNNNKKGNDNNVAFSVWTLHESEERHLSLAGGKASSSLAAGGPVLVLEWSRDDDNDNKTTEKKKTTSTAAAAWRETFVFLERILVFIADHVLLSRPQLCEMVGRRFLGAPSALPSALRLEALGLESCRIGNDNGLLMEPLVESLAETCIPIFLKPDQLDQLYTTKQELDSIVDHFLDRMIEKGLLSDKKTTRLADFVSNFEHKYVQNRRCLRLNQARTLLMDNDYHNTVPVGVEIHQSPDEHLGLHDGMDIFRLHKCNISDTASKIMQMCRECMDEAVDYYQSSASSSISRSPLAVLPAILYRTAREVLDLFRAIIPVAHGNEIAHVPRTAAVLHNDCVFFAHHCQILGVEYKEKFAAAATTTSVAVQGGKQQDDDGRGTLLRQTCIFVDMVPLFREMADRSMRKMLDLQASQLVELVGQRITLLGQALREDEIVAEWSEAEAALTTGLHHLKHLANVWKPILSQDVCRRSLCYLADVMFTLLLDQVTNKATDISESACPFVSTLFQRGSNGVSEILGGNHHDNNNSKTTMNSSACRVWDRFIAVGRFMNMNLGDVQIALGDGLFRSVSGPELARLIVATFADSPKRQKVLALLASNN